MLKEFLQGDSIKNQTLKRVYRTIHQHDAITRAELIKATNMKPTTMVRMIDELLENRFIRESGIGASSGGRPPVLYQVEQQAGYILGIDLSRTHTVVVLMDLLFNILDKEAFAMTSFHTPQVTINTMVEKVDLLLNRYQIPLENVLGIGIGTVGPLDKDNGIILKPESFPALGWIDVPIVELLKEKVPVRVVLQNGANTAVLGEYRKSTMPIKNILYCISGVGLRCGVLTNGQLVNNKIGDASAYGHMIIQVNGKKCSCGREGCLTSYISLDSILGEVFRRIMKGEKSSLSDILGGYIQLANVEQLFKAIKQNDPLLNEIILDSARYYGIGLANMVNLIHPEHVILSGPLIYEHPMYYETVIQIAKKFIYNIDKVGITFSQGVLKADAVAVGAGVYLFQTYLD